MTTSRVEAVGSWLGLGGSAPARPHRRPVSQTRRLIFMAAWLALAFGVFLYLHLSASGGDGVGGYLPLITASLVFSTGSLLTMSTLDRGGYGASARATTMKSPGDAHRL